MSPRVETTGCSAVRRASPAAAPGAAARLGRPGELHRGEAERQAAQDDHDGDAEDDEPGGPPLVGEGLLENAHQSTRSASSTRVRRANASAGGAASAATIAARIVERTRPAVGSTPLGTSRSAWYSRTVRGIGERREDRGRDHDHGIEGAHEDPADHPRGADGEEIDERGQPERPHQQYVDDQPSEEGPDEATLEAQRHRPDDGDDEDEIEAPAACGGEGQDG